MADTRANGSLVAQKVRNLKKPAIHWLEPASLDLVEIIEYISRDRPDAARKLGRDILLTAKRLGRSPRRGKLVPELRDQGMNEYREIFVGVYRIVYDIQPESIDILAVLDGRRDARTILLQRSMR